MRVRITAELPIQKKIIRQIRSTLTQILEVLAVGFDPEVSVLLVDSDRMRKLNNSYRGKDEVTDVLAFPMMSKEEIEDIRYEKKRNPEILGDVVICVPEAIRQASFSDNTLADEIRLLSVHGLLHLVGYDHDSEENARAMTAIESNLINTKSIKSN